MNDLEQYQNCLIDGSVTHELYIIENIDLSRVWDLEVDRVSSRLRKLRRGQEVHALISPFVDFYLYQNLFAVL